MRSVHRRLSASGLDVARRCPSSFALPAVDTGSSDAATAGTGRHAFLDAFAGAWNSSRDVASARESALATVPLDAPWREACEGIDLDAQVLMPNGELPATILYGKGFAMLPGASAAVEALGDISARAYRHAEPWVCGTYDWLLLPSDAGTPVLVDFKGSSRTVPARENLQLAFYGACAAAAHGFSSLRVELRYISDDGSIFVDHATQDQWDWDATMTRVGEIAAEVDAARALLAAGQPSPLTVGSHCTWCPSLRMCPAHLASLRALAEEGERAALDAVGFDLEAAGRAWVRIDALIVLAERVKATLRERAITEGGFPLPGGDRLAVVRGERTSIDVTKALEILRGIVGDRVDAVVERTISTGSVDRFAAELARARGETVKASKSALWKALEPATTQSSFVQLRVKKA